MLTGTKVSYYSSKVVSHEPLLCSLLIQAIPFAYRLLVVHENGIYLTICSHLLRTTSFLISVIGNDLRREASSIEE